MATGEYQEIEGAADNVVVAACNPNEHVNDNNANLDADDDNEGDDYSKSINSDNDKWECNKCSYLNHAAMTYCGQCDCDEPVTNDENVEIPSQQQQQSNYNVEALNNRSDEFNICAMCIDCVTWRIVIIVIICITCILVAVIVCFLIFPASNVDPAANVGPAANVDPTANVDSDQYHFGWWCSFDGGYEVEGGCGEKINSSGKEAYCPYECKYIYPNSYNDYHDYVMDAYFVRNTSMCYCKYYTHFWFKDTFDCFGFNDSNFDVLKWEISCPDYGRPYNIYSAVDLKADIKYIGCNDYRYYDNIEWIEFVVNNNNNNNNNNFIDYDEMNKWKTRALSEHASIATFSKFSLELMSIGAPLWFIKLSNDASLDEIKHSEISFDIANMYLNNINDDNYCMISNKFPNHIVNIDRDWNVISKDTAIGGCIGETISIFKGINDYKYNNMIDKYLYEISMEEINHSALAWTTIKWMIHNSPNNINLDIKNNNWWKKQIKNSKQQLLLSNNNHLLLYVYDVIIPSILNKIWTNSTYKQLYKSIIHKLQYELNNKFQTTCFI